MTAQAKRQSLFSAIRYEVREGIHTYHQCSCRRMATRAGQCVLCLGEALAALYNEPVFSHETGQEPKTI